MNYPGVFESSGRVDGHSRDCDSRPRRPTGDEKGGRIFRNLQPAKTIHVVAFWPCIYEQLMHQNVWLHTLPDCTTFQTAIDILHEWNTWDVVPALVRRHLQKVDPSQETLKAAEFKKIPSRIFEIMPQRAGSPQAALLKAEELGFKAMILAEKLTAIEASQAALLTAAIEGAANIQIDTCSPNFLIQEGIETWGGFHARILKEPICWENGFIIPPTKPGLGVELNEEVAAAHPYTGKKLHIEVYDRPVVG